MTFLGIDPGLTGGIAILNGSTVAAFPMPETERDLWDLIRPYGTLTTRNPDRGLTTFAVLEKVAGIIPKNRNQAGLSRSQFTFGKSYGLCYMALIAASIPFDLVVPRRWQKDLGTARGKSESSYQWKGRLKGIAQRLFPQVTVTRETADALLLADYCRRVYHQ